ncbi:MAG: methyltransferase domain-containing protein [Deltaproteobacteria bacterium]|nr:methyltransferase domain-containing protein [Deltaproteobacteria bacterium]
MDDVARYYDDNTSWFLRFDRSGARVIHRPVWADGARTEEEAAHHVHELVARALEGRRPARILDLGCGVGATAFWLHDRLGAKVHGISISRRQVAIAEQHARDFAARMGTHPSSRVPPSADPHACTFSVRDFLDLGDLEEHDAAVAIESFAHAADPSRFFAEVARVLSPGGTLFLCDDFLAGAPSPARDACIARFTRGWRLRSLLERRHVIELAAQAGFEAVSGVVLTPHLRLVSRRLLAPLRMAGAALERAGAALGRPRLALVDNLVGGTALQEAQHEGWTEYVLLELRRR